MSGVGPATGNEYCLNPTIAFVFNEEHFLLLIVSSRWTNGKSSDLHAWMTLTPR